MIDKIGRIDKQPIKSCLNKILQYVINQTHNPYFTAQFGVHGLYLNYTIYDDKITTCKAASFTLINIKLFNGKRKCKDT